MRVKFTCRAIRWFDKVNGNTYHSVRVTRCRDGKVIVGEFQYGYGDHYRQTALAIMSTAKWLPKQYRNGLENAWPMVLGGCGSKGSQSRYERENNYPIQWNVTEGLKKDCVSNGIA